MTKKIKKGGLPRSRSVGRRRKISSTINKKPEASAVATIQSREPASASAVVVPPRITPRITPRMTRSRSIGRKKINQYIKACD